MVKIVVIVERGMVTQVLCSRPGVEVDIIDLDSDDAELRAELDAAATAARASLSDVTP